MHKQMITGIGPFIIVRDFPASLKFYGDMLEFEFQDIDGYILYFGRPLE